MKFSIVIPARNEEGCIAETVDALVRATGAAAIPTEILVVDDGSTDGTAACVHGLEKRYPEVRLVENHGRHGFGMAVRTGIQHVARPSAIMPAARPPGRG